MIFWKFPLVEQLPISYLLGSPVRGLRDAAPLPTTDLFGVFLDIWTWKIPFCFFGLNRGKPLHFDLLNITLNISKLDVRPPSITSTTSNWRLRYLNAEWGIGNWVLPVLTPLNSTVKIPRKFPPKKQKQHFSSIWSPCCTVGGHPHKTPCRKWLQHGSRGCLYQ